MANYSIIEDEFGSGSRRRRRLLRHGFTGGAAQTAPSPGESGNTAGDKYTAECPTCCTTVEATIVGPQCVISDHQDEMDASQECAGSGARMGASAATKVTGTPGV